MFDMQNLSAEEQMKVNMLAGSFMAGFFRTAGIGLNVTGSALKTATGLTAAVLNKTADVIDSAGNTGGDILIGLGDSAHKKADEYNDAVALCNKILNGGTKPLNTELAA